MKSNSWLLLLETFLRLTHYYNEDLMLQKCWVGYLFFVKFTIQVEVKIDKSAVSIHNATSEDKFTANFTIDAEIFDTGSCYAGNGHVDLLSTNVAHLQMTQSVDYILGFIGYHLSGKVQMPKLWSAEQVKFFSHMICLLHSSWFKC